RRRRPRPAARNWVMGDALVDECGHIDSVAAELNQPARARITARLGRLGTVELDEGADSS
ncbi:MAG: hypothetical protein VKK62_02075, partial [Synechococcaceae cyanobacterium]|nr:hypothetical protein [Synechococcaceae cyanobacterium]